jgi:hypothetical protein
MNWMQKTAALTSALIVAAGIGVASGQTAQQPSQGTPGMMMQGSGRIPMMGSGEIPIMGSGGMPMMGMMDPGDMMCGLASHVDGSLAYMKAELRITDAQTPQWNGFADAFRANAQKLAQQCAATMGQGGNMMMAMMAGTLPERLDRMEQHITLHLESLRTMKAAVQPLYAALSDEQKRIADQLIRPMGMM